MVGFIKIALVLWSIKIGRQAANNVNTHQISSRVGRDIPHRLNDITDILVSHNFLCSGCVEIPGIMHGKLYNDVRGCKSIRGNWNILTCQIEFLQAGVTLVLLSVCLYRNGVPRMMFGLATGKKLSNISYIALMPSSVSKLAAGIRRVPRVMILPTLWNHHPELALVTWFGVLLREDDSQPQRRSHIYQRTSSRRVAFRWWQCRFETRRNQTYASKTLSLLLKWVLGWHLSSC